MLDALEPDVQYGRLFADRDAQTEIRAFLVSIDGGLAARTHDVTGFWR